MLNLTDLTVPEMLRLHSRIGEELRSRKVLRSANNPTGDLAEYLFCQAFAWSQASNSTKGYDATDTKGLRYQIKGRRLHQRNNSRQLSVVRNLEMDPFDTLAGVLFSETFSVLRAALIPISIVKDRSNYHSHPNGHIFLLHDDVWTLGGVEDVTDRLKAVPL